MVMKVMKVMLMMLMVMMSDDDDNCDAETVTINTSKSSPSAVSAFRCGPANLTSLRGWHYKINSFYWRFLAAKPVRYARVFIPPGFWFLVRRLEFSVC